MPYLSHTCARPHLGHPHKDLQFEHKQRFGNGLRRDLGFSGFVETSASRRLECREAEVSTKPDPDRRLVRERLRLSIRIYTKPDRNPDGRLVRGRPEPQQQHSVDLRHFCDKSQNLRSSRKAERTFADVYATAGPSLDHAPWDNEEVKRRLSLKAKPPYDHAVSASHPPAASTAMRAHRPIADPSWCTQKME
eukprot:1902704-Prymnesium_polylepis.1